MISQHWTERTERTARAHVGTAGTRDPDTPRRAGALRDARAGRVLNVQRPTGGDREPEPHHRPRPLAARDRPAEHRRLHAAEEDQRADAGVDAHVRERERRRERGHASSASTTAPLTSRTAV